MSCRWGHLFYIIIIITSIIYQCLQPEPVNIVVQLECLMAMVVQKNYANVDVATVFDTVTENIKKRITKAQSKVAASNESETKATTQS